MKSADIHQGHAAFRQILQAMSHPGAIFPMTDLEPITDKHASLLHMLGCLMDNEVTFTVIGDVAGSLSTAITRNIGSTRADIGVSDFIIATCGTTDGQLIHIKRGTLEYPDQGATLVYLVEEINEDGGSAELSGPGIKGSRSPRFTGLASAELAALREVNAEYPLGVDAIFLDATGKMACIPRSTRIKEN